MPVLKLFVGDLPKPTSESVLKHAFEQRGIRVRAVNIPIGEKYGTAQSYGFVRVLTDLDADALLRELRDLTINGKDVSVELARTRDDDQADSSLRKLGWIGR